MMRSAQTRINRTTLRRDRTGAAWQALHCAAQPLLFALIVLGCWLAGPMILSALLGEPMLVLAQ